MVTHKNSRRTIKTYLQIEKRGKDEEKIVIVGGCGHVGLPLGLALASRKHQVTLLDLNRDAVEKIRCKQLPYVEEGGQTLLENLPEGQLQAVTDPCCISDAEVVIFVNGTPVDEHLNPRVKDVLNVLRQYQQYLRNGQLLVLRSTLFPGTMRVISSTLQKAQKEVLLAFCPERILQGKGIEEIFKLPQIVSGVTPEAEEQAAALFETIAPEIIRVTPEEAELAKLMTNSWRYLEFAIANQFYIMAESHGLDFYRIYHAMCKGYPRAASFARPGLAAGPCLFKDTMQLAAYHDNLFFLGHSAMLINEGLPSVLVKQLEKKLGNDLARKKIAILGMTFKADNDDIRESLSFKIKKILEQKLAEVIMSDPFLKDTVPLEQALAEADGIIIGSPHSLYKGLSTDIPCIDCWNILKQK